MKRVDAREFAAHAAEYLAAGKPLEIEQDGRVIGRYRPVPAAETAAQPPNGPATNGATSTRVEDRIRPESRKAIERLDQLLQQIYAETGMAEDEFASYFDTTKPFPYDKVPES